METRRRPREARAGEPTGAGTTVNGPRCTGCGGQSTFEGEEVGAKVCARETERRIPGERRETRCPRLDVPSLSPGREGMMKKISRHLTTGSPVVLGSRPHKHPADWLQHPVEENLELMDDLGRPCPEADVMEPHAALVAACNAVQPTRGGRRRKGRGDQRLNGKLADHGG